MPSGKVYKAIHAVDPKYATKITDQQCQISTHFDKKKCKMYCTKMIEGVCKGLEIEIE